MKLNTIGKNLTVSDALNERVSGRMEQMVNRFLGDSSGTPHCQIVFELEGSFFRTNCLIRIPPDVSILAHADGADAYVSFDLAASRLEKRLRRFHDRQRQSKHKSDTVRRSNLPSLAAPSTVFKFSSQSTDTKSDHRDDFTAVIVAEEIEMLSTFTVADAVSELDITGANALVFRHAGNGGISLVFRRSDGHIGWIDTKAASSS